MTTTRLIGNGDGADDAFFGVCVYHCSVSLILNVHIVTLSCSPSRAHTHTHARALYKKCVHWSTEKKPNISTKFNWKHACDMLIFSLFTHWHTQTYFTFFMRPDVVVFFLSVFVKCKTCKCSIATKVFIQIRKKYTYLNTHIHVQITHLNSRTYNENQWSNEWQAKKRIFFKRQMYINKQFENWFFINWWNTESMELNWIRSNGRWC